MSAQEQLNAALEKNAIIPVMTVNSEAHALELGGKLVAEGYTVLEITLRTDSALDGIRVIKEAWPDLIVGAGTILSKGDADNALAVGSDFLVTPATSPRLAEALLDMPVPVIPGISTATEAQTLYDMGYKQLKFFPVESCGGAKMLKSLSSPLPHLMFMPSGGIKKETADDYLSLPNVFAIGGSWMTK